MLQSPEPLRKGCLVSKERARKRMSVAIKPLLPTSSKNSKVYFYVLLFSTGKIVALYASFSCSWLDFANEDL